MEEGLSEKQADICHTKRGARWSTNGCLRKAVSGWVGAFVVSTCVYLLGYNIGH